MVHDSEKKDLMALNAISGTHVDKYLVLSGKINDPSSSTDPNNPVYPKVMVAIENVIINQASDGKMIDVSPVEKCKENDD